MAGKFSEAVTEERLDRFLEAYGATGSIRKASAATRISLQSVYHYRNTNESYRSKFDAVQKAGRRAQADLVFEDAIERATEGWLEPVFQRGEKVGTRRRYSERLHLALLERLWSRVGGLEPVAESASVEHQFNPVMVRAMLQSMLQATLEQMLRGVFQQVGATQALAMLDAPEDSEEEDPEEDDQNEV